MKNIKSKYYSLMSKKAVGVFAVLMLFLTISLVSAATDTSKVNINATVISESSSGGLAIGDDGSPPGPATTLEIVPAFGDLSQDCGSITINWKTEIHQSGEYDSDVISSTEVGYLIEGNSVYDVVTGEEGVDHSVTIDDLKIGERYVYYIYSSDGSLSKKNLGGKFTVSCTLSSPEVEVKAVNRGTEINIDYPTGEDVAQLVIRRSTAGPVSSMSEGQDFYQGEPENTVYDVNTTKNTTYWYTVFICNGDNLCSQGVFGKAQRLVPDITSPMAQAGDGKINLFWTNPSSNQDVDFAYSGVRVIRLDDNNCDGAGIDDGELLVQGTIASYEDTSLTNYQPYYYKIFVKNSYNEYSAGECVSATPNKEAGMYCVSSVGTLAGDGWIEVGWQNPDSSQEDFTLNNIIWQRDNLCVGSVSEGKKVYEGLGNKFTDSDLENSERYSYTAFVDYNDGQVLNCGCVSDRPVSDDEEEELFEMDGVEYIDEVGDYKFYINKGALPIDVKSDNTLMTLPDRDLLVTVDRSDMPKPVNTIVAQINKKNYFISLNTSQNEYQASIKAPSLVGSYQLTITTIYNDETANKKSWTVQVAPLGRITNDRAGLNRISDARVTLLDSSDVPVHGFGIMNPRQTDGDGLYGFMAPNGEYKLRIEAQGYKTYLSKKIRIQNHIINERIVLIKDQTLLQAIIGGVSHPETLMDNIRGVVLGGFLDNPMVESLNENYIAPAVVALASISAISAIPWWGLVHYIQALFTEPLMLLTRKRRKGWGVVYNSVTKEPVDLAVVRLYDKTSKKLLQSHITDKEGRYHFLVGGGNYYIEVVKPNFVFPSALLGRVEEDEKYVDLYHGDDIEVASDQKGAIVANIPLDQGDVSLSDKQVLRKNFWQGIKKNISVVGPAFSIISFAISPTIMIGVFVVIHFILYFLFKRLAEHKTSKSWGIVYDKESKEMLGSAIVRIFSPEYDKMLDVQVTDKAGRYGFLAGHNIYYLAASKEGYNEHKTGHIDLRGKRKEDVVGQDLALEPVADKKKNKRKKTETAASPL